MKVHCRCEAILYLWWLVRATQQFSFHINSIFAFENHDCRLNKMFRFGKTNFSIKILFSFCSNLFLHQEYLFHFEQTTGTLLAPNAILIL